MTLATEDNVQRGPQVKIPMPSVGVEQYILAKLREHGDNVAQVYPELGNKSFTYSDIQRRALLVAKTMSRLGLKKGDVVAAAMLSRPQFTPLLIGCMLKGILLAPVNPKFDKHDRRHVLKILRPRLLITENPEWADDHPNCQVLSTAEVESWLEDADNTHTSKYSNGFANGHSNGHKNGHINGNVNGHLNGHSNGDVKGYSNGHTNGHSNDDDEDDPLDAPALVLCSSGTGGSPRGVAIRHRALLQLAAIAGASGMMKFEDAAFMMVTPVFWVSAIAIQMVAITAGARMVVLSEYEDQIFLKSIKEHKVIGTLMSPHLGVHLLKKSPQPDVTPLMFIIFAGASMDASTQVAIQNKFRLKINQMYGMTELLLVLGDDHRKPTPPGSVGKVHIGTEAKVLDPETGKALGPNKPGELCFRGPTVMRGYFNDDKSTAAAIDSEGWFHTGDVGYYDEDGYFFITDRMKDLIKYRGEHVPSSELEALLLKHPAVKDAAVVGVPDPVDTELPRAYIALNGDVKATEEDIINYVEREVADHKRLRGGVVIMDKVPRTGSGKLYKRVIREMIRAELAAK